MGPDGPDTKVIDDPAAPALWARFYDLETGKPFFCGRDGIKHDSLDQIPNGVAKERGIKFGERAAAHIINLRTDDGRFADVRFTKRPKPGGCLFSQEGFLTLGP